MYQHFFTDEGLSRVGEKCTARFPGDFDVVLVEWKTLALVTDKYSQTVTNTRLHTLMHMHMHAHEHKSDTHKPDTRHIIYVYVLLHTTVFYLCEKSILTQRQVRMFAHIWENKHSALTVPAISGTKRHARSLGKTIKLRQSHKIGN